MTPVKRKVKLADLKIGSFHQGVNARHPLLKLDDHPYDEKFAGDLVVVEDGRGGLILLDGVHRRAAAMSVGIEEASALVYPPLDHEEQARIFLNINTRPR